MIIKTLASLDTLEIESIFKSSNHQIIKSSNQLIATA